MLRNAVSVPSVLPLIRVEQTQGWLSSLVHN